MYDYVWHYSCLCMTMYDNVWLCLTKIERSDKGNPYVWIFQSVHFRIHITWSTLWDYNCYKTTSKISKSQKMPKNAKKCKKIFINPKTSKIENINEKGKQLNPHASISTLCLFEKQMRKSWNLLIYCVFFLLKSFFFVNLEGIVKSFQKYCKQLFNITQYYQIFNQYWTMLINDITRVLIDIVKYTSQLLNIDRC